MSSMEKKKQKKKIQAAGWVRSKPSREKKRENLEHGLLLMLFFSCKRKKNRTEITL